MCSLRGQLVDDLNEIAIQIPSYILVINMLTRSSTFYTIHLLQWQVEPTNFH